MHAPRDCATCGETQCAMHDISRLAVISGERTSYILDDAWPEYASLVAAQVRPSDQVLAPDLPSGSRYRWGSYTQPVASMATLRRHLAMRRVRQAPGAVRQTTYLRSDRDLAHALARRIDYRAGHLVVAQRWLPWLDETGALGGRSYDVLMQRYPLRELHRLLDAAAAELGKAPSLTDFRAEPALVEREAGLLARARRVVTPHHGIAALFPRQVSLLAWHKPAAINSSSGNRVAFLGPTIARERPDIARHLAVGLDHPLIVFGAMIEPDWWSGLSIERRALDANWLREVGTILHPAAVTHQPRRLLEAVASGVRVCATPTCGLAPSDYVDLASAQGSLVQA
jgi:hypothetical protein